MTDLNGPWTQASEITDDANVLITISSSEADGMIRRWGVVGHAIGDLSVEALIRGAVDDRVLELLRAQRPQQHQREQSVAQKVKSVLGAGYRVFVRDSDDPIDSARAGNIQARSLLARGNPDYQTGSFYVLHLTVEPFGAAGIAPRRDDAGADTACDALSRDMCLAFAADAEPALAAIAAVNEDQGIAAAAAAHSAEPAPPMLSSGGYHLSHAVGVEERIEATAYPRDDGCDVGEEPPAAVCAAVEETGPESPGEAADIFSPGPSVDAAAVAAVAAREIECAAECESAPTFEAGQAAQVAPVAAETVELEAEAEQVAAVEQAAPVAVVQAQPKKPATKAEALMEQFRPKVAALDFRGLFVGNFGFQRDTVVDVSKLSTLSPQTVSAYLMKANALRQSGEHEKALSYYRVLLKSDSENADYRFLYGKTLIEMGRIQPARECLERARELGHENAAHELEQLEQREAKKPALAFLQFWRRAESKR